MPNSALRKMLAGKRLGAAGKRESRALILSNLNCKAFPYLLNYELNELGAHFSFFESDYSNYLAFVIMKKEEILAYAPNVVFFVFDSSYYLDERGIIKEIKEVERNVKELAEGVKRISTLLSAHEEGKEIKFLMSSLPYDSDKLYQYISLKEREDFRKIVTNFFSEMLDEFSLQNVIDISDFNGATIEEIYSDHNIVASLEYLEVLARKYKSLLRLSLGKSLKCVVTDLDNTFWDGVIAEEGVEQGLGSEKRESFNAYRAFLLNLYRQGVILSIASKNDPSFIEEVFSKHKEELGIELSNFIYPHIN